MAIGRQKSARQADLLVSTSDLARSPGHPFYERVNVLLSKADFNAFADADRPLRARRTLQLHVEVGRHRARRFARAALLHQVPRRGPVRVAVEERADDPAVDDAGKRFVVLLGRPIDDDRVALDATLDAQPLRVRGAAAEALVLGREAPLEVVGHDTRERSEGAELRRREPLRTSCVRRRALGDALELRGHARRDARERRLVGNTGFEPVTSTL